MLKIIFKNVAVRSVNTPYSFYKTKNKVRKSRDTFPFYETSLRVYLFQITRKHNLNATFGNLNPFAEVPPSLYHLPLFRSGLQTPLAASAVAAPQSADSLAAEAPLMSSAHRLAITRIKSVSETSVASARKQPVRLLSRPRIRIDSCELSSE